MCPSSNDAHNSEIKIQQAAFAELKANVDHLLVQAALPLPVKLPRQKAK